MPDKKREYQKHEFCKDIACFYYLVSADKCLHNNCIETARDFLSWLRLHDYEIIKKEAGNG